MSKDAFIKFQNISKSFPVGFWGKPKQVIFDANFEIKKGEVTGFVGSNGSGKTTLLKLGLGFIFPTQGEISYPVSGSYNEFRKSLGYLPERPYYYDFLSAREFLKLHWDISGGGAGFFEAEERVLDRVRLKDVQFKYLKTFSKGMLQRIGIAQSLLREPSLLLLDEPMSGLDPDGRYQIKSILKEEKAKGRTLFFSSHLMEDVELICDNVVIVDKGQIKFSGLISELKAQSGSDDLDEIIYQLKNT